MSATTAARVVSAQEFPGTLPIEQQLRFLLRYAVLAPSARNAQPWRFSIRDHAVLLHADLERWQPVADPDQREVYLSLGCALENLLVAGERFGLRHSVAYFPQPGDELLAAAVSFEPGGRLSPNRVRLTLEAILERRTAHGAFTGRPLLPAQLAALEECARDDEVAVTFSEEQGRRRAVEGLIEAASEAQTSRPAYRRELAGLMGERGLGVPRPLAGLGRLALGSATVTRWIERAELAAFRSAPLLALITAHRDDHRAHLRSGQVLERLWLAATGLGLGLQPASVVVEVPEVRSELARAFGLPPGTCAQELVRIGEPARAFGFTTPRRPVEEVTGA